MHTTLISVADLRVTLESVVIIDCRFDLAQPDAGYNAYAKGHIPGALYAHLNADLSSPVAPATGRHPLPDPHALATTFGRWGISAGTQVIAYDADAGMFASRLWWLLRWLGHSAVAVLDGGLKAWEAASLPLSTAIPTPQPANFVGSAHDNMVVSTLEVASLMSNTTWCLHDARAPERFRGEIEPIDPVAGHVPGARNHPFAWNMGSNGRLLPPDELRAKYLATLAGAKPEHTVAMCGSGVTACHNLLAMETAGMSGAKLYAGSWSEWIRDPSRPIARGES